MFRFPPDPVSSKNVHAAHRKKRSRQNIHGLSVPPKGGNLLISHPPPYPLMTSQPPPRITPNQEELFSSLTSVVVVRTKEVKIPKKMPKILMLLKMPFCRTKHFHLSRPGSRTIVMSNLTNVSRILL
jgi:hypothetical protein